MSKKKYKIEGSIVLTRPTSTTSSPTKAQLSEPILKRSKSSRNWYSIEWVTEETRALKVLGILATIYAEAFSEELGSNCFSRLTLEELFFIFEESDRVELVTIFIKKYTYSREDDLFFMLENLLTLCKFSHVKQVEAFLQTEQPLRAKIHKELDF